MDEEILAVIQASGPRRGFGVAVLVILGVLVIYIAMAQPPASPLWQVFLLAFGVVVLWLAQRMWQATKTTIVLTEKELRGSDGVLIAEVDKIEAIDRGVLAFKPSNGFMLRLRDKAPRSWQPGLWWRMGRRVGVGGVTSAAQTKGMAEMIAALISDR